MFTKTILFSIIMISSTISYAQERLQFFDQNGDRAFEEVRKGMSNIQVNRYIVMDVEINLSTGILNGQWHEGPDTEIKILDVKTPHHMIKAEVFIAKPYTCKEVFGHYFVLFITKLSRPKSDGGGYCGSGIEEEIVVIRTDEKGDISHEERFLVFSCMKMISGVFIRDDDPHDLIYVIYGDEQTGDQETGERLRMLIIDYLHPQKDVVQFVAKEVIGEDK